MVDFNLISLNVSLLGSQFNAKNSIGSSAFSASSASFQSRGPAVITPWGEEDDRSLVSRFNQLRNKTTFINENTSAVKEAGFDKDNKALFTLYSALNDLRTIAEYASDDKTSSSLIAKLSTQFQSGLSEVDTYIREAELDKLILLAGEKKSNVISTAASGKNNNEIEGSAIAISKTATLANLNGDEVFTISISDGFDAADDIVIDLSEISGAVSLTTLRSLINSKIAEVTEVNGNGETVTKYKSRIQISEIEDGKFGFTFDVAGIEDVSFTAASSDPSLIITGTTKSGDFGAIQTGTLSEYKDLDGSGIIKSYSHDIAGIDANGFVIPADPDDESSEETPSTTVKFETTPIAVQVDSQGNSYVVGTTEGDFDGQINGAQKNDVFLSKYDSVGNLVYSRLLGASDDAQAFEIAVDGDDNVIIAGKTNEELVSSDVFSGTDSFVAKYSADGEELFVKQLDTIATDQANSLTVDDNGDIYFIGQVSGRLNTTTTDNGGVDSIVVKLGGTSGVLLEATQFGGASNDYGKNIAIASDGNIVVVSEEDGNAVIRKLDKNNLDTTLATYNIGDLNGGEVTGIAVDGDDIYVSGSTLNGTLNGGSVTSSYSDGKDGFVTKINDNGGGLSADFTTFLGTSASDSISDITVKNGEVYVSGVTSGTLAGESKTGITDGFVAKLDAVSGALLWQEQLGGEIGGYNEATGISFSADGSSVLDKLGIPTGNLGRSETRNVETQTSLRAGDYFYVSANGGRDIKITIQDGDTFDRLATRINALSTRNLKASVSLGENGSSLKLEAINGATVDLKAGADGRDALSKLGIEERSIISSEVLFDLDKSDEIDPEKLGGIFALGINNGFAFSNRTEAEYIFKQLNDAIRVIESAHRSLTFDPVRAQLLQDSKSNIGPAPAFLQDRLARYQDGLQRVLAVTGGTFI